MRPHMPAVTLASLLLAGAVGPTLAQEADDSDSATRTLTMPRAGLAATFPANWRIWAYPMEEPGAWNAVDVDAREDCHFLFLEGATSAEESDPYWEGFESSDHQEVMERGPLTVPAGDAMYAAWRFLFEDRPPGAVSHEYHLAAPDGVLRVRCYAEAEPPSDRFLSIIETIRPLSADPPPSTAFDPRVEMPSLRLALELPERWELSLGSRTAAGDLFGGPMAFIAIDRDAEDATRCELETLDDAWPLTTMTTDDWRVQVADMKAQFPDWASAEVVVLEHELPAGTATRVAIDWSDGWSTDMWILAEGDRMVGLTCKSRSTPPADRWGSIAETMEILPPAE